MLTAAAIKAKARELGFDLCGIAPVGDHPELKFLRTWLDRGYAGEMAYLERSADRRSDVRRVLPSARTVIVTGTIYNTQRPYSTESADPDRAHIARYAWGDDYHDVIGRRLDELLAWMQQRSRAASAPFEGRAYVDTGPVQERVYAQYAGLGWIGKNTCVINPELGSWVFLSEIICNLPLMRHVHPVSRGVSDAGDCRAWRARLDALHFVSDDRTQGRHSAVSSVRHRQSRLRLRRLPGSLSLERNACRVERSRVAAAPPVGRPDNHRVGRALRRRASNRHAWKRHAAQ